VSLFGGDQRPPLWQLIASIIKVGWMSGCKTFFFCHYERPVVLISAIVFRLLGFRVFVMNDSKYDDYPRVLWREMGKSLLHLPYSGGLAGSPRAADYMRFLGLNRRPIALGYDAISVSRLRAASSGGQIRPFNDRDFLVVARLVPKKNLDLVIEAFRLFSCQDASGRKLNICGSGPLAAELDEKIVAAGLTGKVTLHGFQEPDVVATYMAEALCLILVSREEQFGIVVAEAISLGIPVIVSPNCGARDELVRSGRNAFIVEPDNPEGLARYMKFLSEDEDLWRDMSNEAFLSAESADVSRFVASVCSLAGLTPPLPDPHAKPH
jgi:glycosyltransferase involved in cell wall biosynthesis